MATKAFLRKYVPAEVIPLIIPVSMACCLGTYMSFRTLSGAPDVQVMGKTPRFEDGAHRTDPHFAGKKKNHTIVFVCFFFPLCKCTFHSPFFGYNVND